MRTINIVGYDNWYTEKPWCRNGMEGQKEFNITFNKSESDITYFIKDGIFKTDSVSKANVRVALLTECRLMDPRRYNFLENNHTLFDYIVTYDDELLEKFPNKIIITPYSSTWIWPEHNQKVHPKTQLCSYITSNKQYTASQKMRINLLNYYSSNNDPKINLYGRGHNPLPENHENGDYDGKIYGLKDFYFSLAIENHIQRNYFSEKLMDCLLTGTIPIYYGCSEISKYFNPEGIICFDTEEEAKEIIKNLTITDYNNRIDAVYENLELAKQYRDTVEYSYKQLNKKL
tara:strand:- start:1464 stop:2327 length:864 start_codon:yes stop_codon:yes gene_type:complete